MRYRSSVFLCLMVALVGSMALSPAYAQTIYGSISGNVTDQTGAAIPGAEITVRNLSTGQTRQTVSDEIGFYRVGSLPSGQYSVQVAMPSFETIIRQPITVAVSGEAGVDVTIRPAGAQELVTVTAEAPLVETTRGQISKNVSAQQIMELPGRNVMTGLALLQPGAAPNTNSRPGSGFVVNGGRTRSNNFTIDGANNNDQSLSIPRVNLPPEAIQEFQLITNGFSAEYGRNSGSYVNVITRSGTNDIHGAAHWTWAGNGLDALSTTRERTFKAARNAGLSDKQALRRARGVVVNNLGGLTVGGPIKRDHTFFFSSYDRDWYRTTAVPSAARALSAEAVSNLRAYEQEFAPGALKFLLDTFPVANDPTPRGTTNIKTPSGATVALPIQQFNRGLAGSFPFGTDAWRYLQKLDTRLSENDTLSARYLIYEYTNPGAPASIPGNEVGQGQRDQSFTLNEVHIFGPRTTNEFRATYSRRNISFLENLPPYVEIGGFNYIGNYNYPQFRKDNMFEYMDNISHSMTKHTFKGGFNILRYQLNSFFAPNINGSVYYPSMQDLLLDKNATYQQYAGDGYVPARTTEAGLFFQDDFRATRNLTLNLGIRWEYTGAPFGYFSNAKPDVNNWAPRFGFAWKSPLSNLVVRGGYAISYDQVFQNILLNVARNYPRGVTVAQIISDQGLYLASNRPAPPTPDKYTGNPAMLPVRLFAPDKRIAQPYSQQFSLGIERQILSSWAVRAFYIGTKGTHLVREVESNLGFYADAVAKNPGVYAPIMPLMQEIKNSAGVVTQYKMDPTRGSVLVADGRASSSYHSMQLTLDKRFSHNFQFQANYTFSAYISDSDDILGGQNNRTLPAVPFNIRLDKARSAFDVPHRFVTNYIYRTPEMFRDNRIVNRMVSGWQITGAITQATGAPYTILTSVNPLGILPGQISTVHLSQRPSVNPSGTWPYATTADQSKYPNPYFIYNAPNSGVIGTLGANTERLGSTTQFDVALVKNVRTWGESQSVQLRWELFNVMNHRNFGIIPARTVSSATDMSQFLNLGMTDVPGRSMLFTLRYTY
jgi:hypothetical protein